MKSWKLMPRMNEGFMELIGEDDEIFAQLLFNRSILSQEERKLFLNPDYDTLRDPYLLMGMGEAVKRIFTAIKKEENIVIFGDYDVDGCTATAILYRALNSFGAKVSYYIPDRMKEGYGMTKIAIEKLSDSGANLIITVDNGTSSYDEVHLAKERGIDVIITDHHVVTKNVPDAVAVINPKQETDPYPFEGICGAVVAFKLVVALSVFLKEQGWDISVEQTKWYLDLAAIGTIADMMPLVDENRVIVKYGLMVLAKTRNKGLLAIAKTAGIDLSKVDVRMVGFSIAPRINAAGRMSHAEHALRLLITEDPQEAQMLAMRIEGLNKERQNKVKDSIDILRQEIAAGSVTDEVFVFQNKDWTSGILGLIAGRISDEFSRPVFCLAEEGGVLKGSARSSVDFHIVEAMQSVSDVLIKFGGHKQAGGLSVDPDNFILFKERIIEYAKTTIGGNGFARELLIDCPLSISAINRKLFDLISGLRHFGQGNPEPVFLAEKVRVYSSRSVGSEGDHLKIDFMDDDGEIKKGIAFGFGKIFDLKEGDRVDIAFSIQENEWMGKSSLEVFVVDIKMSA